MSSSEAPARPTLVGFELVKVRVPLRRPWVSAAGTLDHRDSFLVRAVLRWPDRSAPSVSETEGWGECGALPWPTYTSEYTDGALEVARTYVAPSLLAQGVARGTEVVPALEWLKGHNMVKAAFEMALLDAELRWSGRSLASYLGARSATGPAVATSVTAGVAIGLGASAAEVLAQADGFVAEGYRRVKFKVVPGQETEIVAAARRNWPELVIMVDANGAYAPGGPAAAAEQLAPLSAYGVACIEQPLAADDLLGHAELARRAGVPICLDESLTSVAAVELALTIGACGVVNIKAARLGGYLAAVSAHDVCARAGIPVWCGGMVETGLGRAANVALAALPNFSLPGDVSASSRFFDVDLAGPVRLEARGTIAVPTGPGLGVTPDGEALARFATSRSWYPG